MPAILVLKVRVLLLAAAGSSSTRTCQDHTQDKAANEANESSVTNGEQLSSPCTCRRNCVQR